MHLLCMHKIMIESQNHKRVWVGKNLKGHLVPASLPWARTAFTEPDNNSFEFAKAISTSCMWSKHEDVSLYSIKSQFGTQLTECMY